MTTPQSAEQDHNALLRAIVQACDDAILSRGLDGVVTSWNPAAERIFGYQASEVLGRNLEYTLVPADRLDEREEDARRLAAGETVRHDRTVRLRRDGTPVDVSVTLSPLRDGSGAVVGATVIAREIGEQLAAERQRQLLEARERQVEQLKSLGQLAGGIAHDFNNLLAVILNYAGFVVGELDDPAAARADLEQISVAANRAASLSRQLLAFAQRGTVRVRVFSLNDAIEAASEALGEIVGPGIQIETHLAPDLALVECDPGQLNQILFNLAANARDAMVNGGTLRVETANVALDGSPRGEHAHLPAGSYVSLRVSDNGLGMAPEVLDHVFEPFFSTKPQGSAHGLGLAMVFGSVAQAGGDVRITSEVGAGTTCHVLFPVASRTAAPPSGLPRQGPPEGITVLVVDDEPAVRAAARRHLVAGGCHVLECADGESAVTLAAEYDEAIHVLLSDLLMPGLTGPEVARRIQEIRPGLPVLYMSGYASPELGAALAEGLFLVEKPFTESSLLEGVAAALARRRLEDGQDI